MQTQTETKTEETGDEYYAIAQRGVVRVGVQAAAPPLNYHDGSQVRGLDGEIAALIFAQPAFGIRKVEMKLDALEYDEIPSLLEVRNEDGSFAYDIVMGGLTYSDSDFDDVIFTAPYLDNMGYALISKDGDKINTLKDLEGKTVGIIKDDPDVLELAQQAIPRSAKIITLSDEDKDWMQIAYNQGLCDAFIYDFPFAATEIKETPNSNLKIKIAYIPGKELQYKIGLRRGNEVLRDKLNAAIESIKEIPKYASMLQLYLPTSSVVEPENPGNLAVHVVKRGETLSIIARDKLGDVSRWKEIQSINNIPNPHLILPGRKLFLPK